jgi:hypothetical protein
MLIQIAKSTTNGTEPISTNNVGITTRDNNFEDRVKIYMFA